MENLTIYSEAELHQIQSLELSILKSVVEVCNQLSVTYFLIAGTALGAVRHNGFIPWDDDIDIGMPREDYQKFLEKANDFLPSNMHLQTPYQSNAKHPYSYSKVRLDGTKFVEYSNRNLNMHQGVYMDIFPFDEVPDDDKLNQKHYTEARKCMRLFTLRESPDISCKPIGIKAHCKAIIRRALYYVMQTVPAGYLIREYDKIATQYNGTGQHAIACLDFPKRKKLYIKKSELFPLASHQFESINACIPFDVDAYLTTQYGDYMKFPPKEQRFGHKPYYIDLGTFTNSGFAVK